MSAVTLSSAPAHSRKLRFGALWLAVPGLLFLAVFFVYPVAQLLGLSIVDPESGAFSAGAYQRIAATDVYLRVLGITFRIAGWTAVWSLLIGYPLAYWIARLPDLFRGRMLLFVMVPFWTSYLVKTFAWMIVLGRSGIINSLATGSGIVDQPLPLLHNQFGVMVGMVHAMVPLAVMTMLPVMTGIDRRLVQAAQTLGAAPARAFWLVYFKLSLPGVAAAGLLVFISSLGFFIVPAFLGGRQETMLAQLIITQVQELLNWSFAGALSAMMLAAALVSCVIYDRLFGLSTIAGGSAQVGTGRIRDLGLAILSGVATLAGHLATLARSLLGKRASALLLPGFCWLVIAFLVLPTLLVIPLAFTSSQFLEFPPPGYGLSWFQAYFSSPLWIQATIRSFAVAFVTAIAATAIGGFTALALANSRTRWGGLIFAFFLAPMIVPRIVIAVGLFYLFARLGLIATDLGLVIGHTVLAIPFTLVTIAAVLKTYDQRLDQAAATLGANRLRTLMGVTIPLVKGGLVAAFLFAFITSFDELTIAIFVSGGIKTTLPKQMWDDMILQLNPTLAAVSVVVFVVVTVMLLLAERFRSSS
ncbi:MULTISPECIES: ABC transporter permease subunit [unclassified Bosea (in: a-proteobacteria)]|uniref:ABC transporter permease subunit n=1 Tax=unclassified Bosea (in: a-proteobacteria) TaxID=2653178 RepID=UPI000F75C95D|nr:MULTISPECIES: ABC transporter permease subunit [unclassified Bosea (in: a-proteobacteria)]AZO79944.1 ABC transporter permease [Bosea sp. Tri-49]RXT22721.1 ABC transporter permease [Bosea sp. Tri-39]RXT38189.1 ABC transporter permease [Bosea sp. Tri-54]